MLFCASFLASCLLLLSCSSVFFFFLVLRGVVLLSWILSGDFLFNKRASVTSFAGYYYKILPLYEYFVTWWVFSVPLSSFFLSFCFLIFFLAVWGLGFSGGGTDWLICCNPDCFWGLQAQFLCQSVAMWGLRTYDSIGLTWRIVTGSNSLWLSM